jgi:hypothetical protein
MYFFSLENSILDKMKKYIYIYIYILIKIKQKKKKVNLRSLFEEP